MTIFNRLLTLAYISLFFASTTLAQTDLRVSGAEVGFPVAVPALCFAEKASGEEDPEKQLAELIAKNLDFSGLFKVINPASFVETSSRCLGPEETAYSDWSVIGAEGLIRGEIKRTGFTGGNYEAKLYLLDVSQQKAVFGKRYEFESRDIKRVANRFTNEVIRFFTGQPGMFGSKIAYISKIGRFKELFLMDFDGSNQRQLTYDKGLVVSPSWSPTADKIIYTSYATRTPELYYISPEGGSASQLTSRDGLELGAEFSPDGRSILASASLAGLTNIVQMDLRGKVTRQLTKSGAIDVSPSWSPDGKNVAFCSNRSGGPQIYTMSLDDISRPKRISFTNSKYCTSPSWSPRGDKIAFVCRSAGNQIFVSDPSGQQLVQITFRGNNEDPNWSPDGRYLVFSSDLGRGGARNVVVFSILSGTSRQITFAKSENSQPAWSPIIE